MRAIHLLLVLSLAVLAGCASAPQAPAPSAAVPSAPPAPPAAVSHDQLLFHAFSLVGTPYRYGGSSPESGFDCSGLINYVYRESAGLTLPRTTAGLSALPGTTSVKSLRPGDLVLFSTGGKRVDHAGIYVGDGRFLHAPSTGGRVRVDELDASYWQRAYASARRVLD
ncbi:C40 family peptidase [Halopseudomonas sp. SMJS2]|uniref:C40 family peptidase n=1 Tax=Halopseudomonas sp. SMJS2 TaxID=3041098 RepID=UPI0024536939|nr:C40 family peptidase [Halopseudomonas sp. SMJS2]WGK62935.1 C40 family peptidase [Halopseudomonas sp. SMJS2]